MVGLLFDVCRIPVFGVLIAVEFISSIVLRVCSFVLRFLTCLKYYVNALYACLISLKRFLMCFIVCSFVHRWCLEFVCMVLSCVLLFSHVL